MDTYNPRQKAPGQNSLLALGPSYDSFIAAKVYEISLTSLLIPKAFISLLLNIQLNGPGFRAALRSSGVRSNADMRSRVSLSVNSRFASSSILRSVPGGFCSSGHMDVVESTGVSLLLDSMMGHPPANMHVPQRLHQAEGIIYVLKSYHEPNQS